MEEITQFNPFVIGARVRLNEVNEQRKEEVIKYFTLNYDKTPINRTRRVLNVGHPSYTSFCESKNLNIGINFLRILLLKVPYEKHHMDIKYESFNKELKITKRVFLRERRKLVLLAFISKRAGRKDSYYINPHIFYNGNLASSIDPIYREIVDVKIKY